MKLPWFRHTNSSTPLFQQEISRGSKVVTLLLPQMAENPDKRSALLGENSSLLKYYVNFMENFEEMMERYHTLKSVLWNLAVSSQ